MPHWRKVNDGIKSKLTENNSGVKSSDINNEDRFFGNFFIRVKNTGDKKDKDEQAHKFGAKIVGVGAVIVAVVKGPEEGRGDGNFDVLPSGLIDGSE